MLRAAMIDNTLQTLFAPILDAVRAHAGWAGPLVFLLSLIESLSIVSALVPASLLMLAIGSLAAAGLVSLTELCAWGVVGAGLGYWISYEVGHRYAQRIESIGFLARRPDWIKRGHQFFERWGALAIVVSRFIPLGRAIIPLMAGAMGTGRMGFQWGNWISAVLWTPLMLAPTSIGVALAESLQTASPQTRALLTIAMVVGIFLLIKRFRR
jgi:membrane protein DedA with SNARE-associated domain